MTLQQISSGLMGQRSPIPAGLVDNLMGEWSVFIGMIIVKL